MPEALLRALDITIGRRVDGLLAGDYRSACSARAPSSRRCAPYVPGDDVRRIDWNVTARTGEPHVRVHLAERVLVTWLVLDTSPSMRVRHRRPPQGRRRRGRRARGRPRGHAPRQPARRRHLRRRRPARRCPPRQGRVGLIGLLAALRAEHEVGDGATASARPRSARRRAGRARSRGSARSSWSSPTSAARSTGAGRCSSSPAATTSSRSRSATRASRSCPNAGDLWLVDPETGRQLRVDTRERASSAPASPPPPSRGAKRPAPDARLARRPPRRALDRPATGSGRSALFLQRGAALSFQSPLWLLAARRRSGARRRSTSSSSGGASGTAPRSRPRHSSRTVVDRSPGLAPPPPARRPARRRSRR